MPYKSKAQKLQAAKAHEGRAHKWLEINSDPEMYQEGSDAEVTAWTGSVNNHLINSDDSDFDFDNTEWESELSEDEVDELVGAELVESLHMEIKNEINMLKQAAKTPYKKIVNAKLTGWMPTVMDSLCYSFEHQQKIILNVSKCRPYKGTKILLDTYKGT